MASDRRPIDQMMSQRPRAWLLLILLVYLLLGTLYAVRTPAWQVPDEPAHYNYVKHIAETGRLPELKAGDYPVEYLEEIKSARFPSSMSVEGIRYEAHQPPLYYLLATPVYLLGRAVGLTTPLVPLRLFTLTLGALSLLVAYAAVGEAFPREPGVALGTTAFVGLLPMHVAMTAAVNNDALVELLLGMIAWQLLIIGRSGWSTRRAVVLGLSLGLSLLTKLQAYVGVGLIAFGLFWEVARHRRSRGQLKKLSQHASILLVIALLLVTPWLLRNVTVYGLGDPLAMQRHDQVVLGQLTTPELMAEIGPVALFTRMAQSTFQSFWGQFGWMGVLLPPRVYQALAVLSLVVALGVIDYAVVRVRDRNIAPHRIRALWLLAVWALLTTAGFLWYNLSYVQHQGRYLFPALIPWGVAFYVGLRQLFERRPAWILALVIAIAILILVSGILSGDVKGYALGLVLGTCLGVVTGHAVQRRVAWLPSAVVYASIGCLTFVALQRYVVPYLSP